MLRGDARQWLRDQVPTQTQRLRRRHQLFAHRARPPVNKMGPLPFVLFGSNDCERYCGFVNLVRPCMEVGRVGWRLRRRCSQRRAQVGGEGFRDSKRVQDD